MTVFRICFIIRLFLKYLGWGDVFRRWFLPCWVVGAAASFALPVVPHWLFWLAAFAVFAVFARRFAFAGLMLCVLAGAAYGVFRTEAALSSQWRAEAVSGVPLTVEVADMPRSDGRRVQFAAKAVDSGGRTFDLLLSDYKRREWAVGSRWRITARVHPVVGELNLRGLNREAWALSNGIGGAGTVGADRVLLHGGSGWGIAVWRSRISRNWQQADADGGLSDGIGLMRALSVGEQSALRPELWQAFRPLGLTHLVSISGLHVTMVAVMFAWLAKRLLACSPRLPARPRVWVLAAGCAGALFYALLAGFSVPTQRSVLMLAAFAWAWRRGRLSAWATWWQALAAVLLFDPLAVLGVGTWLSFGLVAALNMGVFGAFARRETANRRARAVGGFGVVAGFARLSVCFAAFNQPFGQCGGDSVVFLGIDAAGVAGFGRAVCAFATVGGIFGGIYFAVFGVACRCVARVCRCRRTFAAVGVGGVCRFAVAAAARLGFASVGGVAVGRVCVLPFTRRAGK